MSGPSDENGTSKQVPSEQRLVYLVPQETVRAADEGLTLLDIWNVLWRGRWIIILVTALCAAAAVAFSLTTAEWYRADVLMAPAEERSAPSLTGALGGLATLAGVTVGGGGTAEPVAVLRSRDFTRDFIESKNLMPILFAELWDQEKRGWRDESPDIRDAVEYFDENVRTVTEDSTTGLVTLAIEWRDPEVAAAWANELVARLNERMRQEALAEAQENVEFLRTELSKTTVLTLQQSIGRLLESELQRLVLARGNEEFAFRVIDRAYPPKQRSRPKRTLIVAVAIVLGGVLGVLVVFARHLIVSSRSRNG